MIRENYKKSSLIIGLFMALLPGLSAQAETADSIVSLREVSILGTKLEKDVFETGRSITVISGEEIKSKGYTSLGELISDLTGLAVTGVEQIIGSNQSVFLRGSNANQTAVYLDGVRISEVSSVNNALDFSEIPINLIDKIEIIKGSAGALHGPSSIGGVINITSMQTTDKKLQLSAGSNASVMDSKGHMIQPYISTKFKIYNNISADAGIEYTTAGNMDATIDTGNHSLKFLPKDDDPWKKLSAKAGLQFQSKKLYVNLRSVITEMDASIDRSAYNDDDNYTLNFKRNILSGTVDYKMSDKAGITISGGITESERHAINDSSIIKSDGEFDHQYTEDLFEGRSANADFTGSVEISGLNLIGGISFLEEKMSQRNYVYSAFYQDPFPPFIYEYTGLLNDARSDIISGYLHADVNGKIVSENLERLNLLAGIRYTKHNLFNENVSLNINPSFLITDKTNFFFSFSTGFNPPSLYQFYSPEKYIPWDGSSPSLSTRGNAQLRPEKSKSFEFGVKHKFENRYSLELSVFHTTTQDQIEYAYLWNGVVALDSLATDFSRDDFRGDTYVNAGEQESYGLDLRSEVQLSKGFSLLAGVTIIQGNFNFDPDDDISKNYIEHIQLFNSGIFLKDQKEIIRGLSRRPSSAQITLRYNVKKINAWYRVRHTEPRLDVFYDTQIKPQGALATTELADYTLSDVGLGFKFNDRIQANTRIENIFNEKFMEIRGFRSKGRSAYLSLIFVL
ncbi:MAG: TonB-dependent receptor [Bacteroidetes bacterium]|nr:MAG: TonB-dependent receptor [Bacteroidota bacterium]REK34200.1 MAG: TonB-dependent receptor [Bacteroidota bacterium]REK50530.1 MAG: TonB-dependent receptor [Bacteroidota bacterium]